MKTRWKIAVGAALALAAVVLTPILYIEGNCRAPIAGAGGGAYRPILPAAERRAEARTWLTYPEWHIVYSADSLGRWLSAGRRPSGYDYGGDIVGFWRSYCAVNRATHTLPAAGDAKVMLYTIGISFTAELAIKALYENTFGRFAEWASGWTSADDRYAARVQTRYGAFMHQTPWYAFPFGAALSGLWDTAEPNQRFRHWERRAALSSEYAVKAGYAKLIGAASGATLGRDELSLRFVMRATPAAIRAIDPRLTPIRSANGLTVVEAPRYAVFTQLLTKLPPKAQLVEIAGNDDIFLTALVPASAKLPATPLLDMPLADRAGWKRIGLSVKVPALPATMRAIERTGGQVEHVYDY